MMNKVLVSGCLLGQKVRYDAKVLTISSQIITMWLEDDRVISVCPEVVSGLSTPRIPAEISNGDGFDVLTDHARVIDRHGKNISAYFRSGARSALALCILHEIKIAVLSESSPSCGSSTIYDGSFAAKKITGVGVTTALLQQNGIHVFNQYQLEAAHKALQQLKD